METKKRTLLGVATIVVLALVAAVALHYIGLWDQNKWFVIGSAIILPWYPIFKHHVIQEP